MSSTQVTMCLVVLTAGIAGVIAIEEKIPCLRAFCKCYKSSKFANCIGTKKHPLSYIPRLPSYVTSANFSRTIYSELTRSLFHNLTFNNITTLSLFNNNITNIQANAFVDLQQLKALEISKNCQLSPENVALGLKSLSSIPGFNELSLRYNKWEKMPVFVFRELASSNVALTKLLLTGNELESISGRHFENLTHLEILDLSLNYLEKIENPEYFQSTNISDLYLSQNKLRQFPSFCMATGDSVMPRLKSLYIANNEFGTKIAPRSFACLSAVKKLILDHNDFSVIENNMFNGLKQLQSLSLMGCKIKGKKIQKFAFNNSELIKLSLSNSGFHFENGKSFYAGYIFNYVPNLKILDLTNTFLPSNSTIIRLMFQNLKEMQKLVLQRVSLNIMPTRVFGRMPKLQTLILNGNYIGGWNDNPDVFENTTSILQLSIDGTRIKMFNKTSFPQNVLSSLQKLNLANNEFTCTCDQLWFMQWIKKTKIQLVNYPHRYRCRFPPDMDKVLLRDYNPTAESCAVKNYTVVIITSVSIVSLVLIVFVVIVYKGRWHIRYWVYLLRFKKKGYMRLANVEDYTYDAFVIYCEDDRQFVHTHLIRELEEREGRRLCVHARDFSVGKLIIDNIMENIYASWKIIIVLSNNFAGSEWCNFELRLAHNRFLEEGNDIIVVAMLEEIEARNLSSSLKALVTTTTYAMWTEEERGNQLFWEQLVAAVNKPIN